ncbi:hypothetical protein BGZ51_001977 [Haplosporangium sp. Z 767]|nr:hypothetical protein BGZ51_001977 [Haplosporangium sp. Z 767]
MPVSSKSPIDYAGYGTHVVGIIGALDDVGLKDLHPNQYWIYSGYIVVRAVSALDLNYGSSREAIHVPYADVSGKMKSLPILFRPTWEEIKVNDQAVLRQQLGGKANKTDFIYASDDEDVPILMFCILDPTRLLSFDLLRDVVEDETISK